MKNQKNITIAVILFALLIVSFYMVTGILTKNKNVSEINEIENTIRDERSSPETLAKDIISIVVYNTSTYVAGSGEDNETLLISDVEEIGGLESFSVQTDEVKAIMDYALYKNEMVLWKGDRIALATMENDKEVYLRISNYGGFFSIVGVEGYYYFDDDKRDAWEELVSSSQFENH